VGGGEHLAQFLGDALGGDAAQFCCVGPDGLGGLFLDGQAEPCREAHGAEEAEVVFGEAFLGDADGAEDSGAKVGEAADVVDDGAVGSGD